MTRRTILRTSFRLTPTFGLTLVSGAPEWAALAVLITVAVMSAGVFLFAAGVPRDVVNLERKG